MIKKRVLTRRISRGAHTCWTTRFRGILTACEGATPPEFAFLLGFGALVVVSGYVFLADNLTGSYTDLSERVEVASTNMPNPLGGGGSIGANAVVRKEAVTAVVTAVVKIFSEKPPRVESSLFFHIPRFSNLLTGHL